MAQSSITDRFGWPVNDWARAAGISRSSAFELLAENKIQSVKYGAKRIIVTHPSQWLASLNSKAA